MMNLRKNTVLRGFFAILTVFGLVFTACKNPAGGGDDIVPPLVAVKKTPISSIEFTVGAPAKGLEPSDPTCAENSKFTISETTWSPEESFTDGKFLGNTVYTATVTLTANSGYTFNGLATPVTIEDREWAASDNTGNTVTLTCVFPATENRQVIGMAIKTQPTNLSYTHGNTLALAGLVVTLTYDVADIDGKTTEDVTYSSTNFTAKNIRTNYANGLSLVHSTHDGQVITVTYGTNSLPQYTNALTVAKANRDFLGHAAINVTYKNGLTLNELQLSNGYVWDDASATFIAGNGQSFAATYTDPSGNFNSVGGTITVNVAKGTVAFPAHDAITVTYTPGLTLAALNAQLQGYCTWDAPTTPLNAGNNQSFLATYNEPSGNFNPANGTITVNVLQTVSPSIFEYYWVNEHGSLVTTSGGAVTVNAGAVLTITAQSDGYTVKQWRLNGIDTGQSGSSYNFSGALPGNYAIGLFVEKEGKLYNTNIIITVVVEVTVTYDINGGTGTIPVAQIFLSNSSITLPSGTGLSRIGHTFGGWNTQADGKGTDYAAGSSYTTTIRNIILYAKWISKASLLVESTWADGNIPSNDEQWFTFIAAASNQYICVSFGTLTNLYVQVYDNNFNAVGDNTRLYGTTSRSRRSLTAGQVYYIQVTPYSNSDNGTYKIGFTSGAFSPETPVIPLTSNIWADGNIPSSNGDQWFKFTATAATQYIHVSFGTVSGGLLVQVFDSSSGTSSYEIYQAFTKQTSWTVTAGQVYYIRVNSDSGTYRIGFNAFKLIEPETPLLPLTANTWADGDLPSNGTQWFSFTATASTQYIYTSLGTLTSMYVQLYDSNFNYVGAVTNLNSTTSSISRSVTAGRVYYIEVFPSNTSYSGTYRIRFN